MPYADGQMPMVNDRVRHDNGMQGTVYNVELNGGNTPGQDQISVKWDDGKSALHIAEECSLLSRGKAK
jgi:hypothetical protein